MSVGTTWGAVMMCPSLSQPQWYLRMQRGETLTPTVSSSLPLPGVHRGEVEYLDFHPNLAVTRW